MRVMRNRFVGAGRGRGVRIPSLSADNRLGDKGKGLTFEDGAEIAAPGRGWSQGIDRVATWGAKEGGRRPWK